jgi:hypothetical protein
MSRSKALACRPSIASLATVIWIAGTAMALAMGDWRQWRRQRR